MIYTLFESRCFLQQFLIHLAKIVKCVLLKVFNVFLLQVLMKLLLEPACQAVGLIFHYV